MSHLRCNRCSNCFSCDSIYRSTIDSNICNRCMNYKAVEKLISTLKIYGEESYTRKRRTKKGQLAREVLAKYGDPEQW